MKILKSGGHCNHCVACYMSTYAVVIDFGDRKSSWKCYCRTILPLFSGFGKMLFICDWKIYLKPYKIVSMQDVVTTCSEGLRNVN